MKYFLFFIILISINCYSQDRPSIFWQNRCEFKTDGSGKSEGLKIKFYYPCAWKSADTDRALIIKKFTYNIGKGKSLTQNVSIGSMPAPLSKVETKQMFTQEGLREIAGNNGTFISERKVKIDGIDCGEIIFKMKRESPIATAYMYFIQYYIVYEDKIVNLSYGTGALTEAEAKDLYTKYKSLFQALATNTMILSKWEKALNIP